MEGPPPPMDYDPAKYDERPARAIPPPQFTDSLSENKELIAMLVQGLTREGQIRAKRTAMRFEKLWQAVIRENPKDPALTLGAAFAVYELAERLTRAQREQPKAEGLIQVVGGI
jgi:hypothetical protein